MLTSRAKTGKSFSFSNEQRYLFLRLHHTFKNTVLKKNWGLFCGSGTRGRSLRIRKACSIGNAAWCTGILSMKGEESPVLDERVYTPLLTHKIAFI